MYSSLYEFCTVRQLEYLEAVEKYGSVRGAAKHLGVNKSTITEAITSVKKKASFRGHSPDHDMTHVVPEGYTVKGVSTYYDQDGKPRGQWVKSTVDADKKEELVRIAVEQLSQEIKGLSPIPEAPKYSHEDILTVIPIGDPHFGMYAWAEEAGEDFNSELARDLTLGAVDRLMSCTPETKTCVIIPLGDVFHANDQSNMTPAHKHQLDVDSRFVKVLGIGIEAYRHSILRALEKHEEVIVRFVAGNHDPQAIWALAFTIQAYFSNNPRVTVDLSPARFWFHRFGKVLIGATHGDTCKHDQLLGVMACDRAEDWGQTKHRYWYTGHVHHQSVREYPGVVCESFRTLAAKDAYAAGHGYRAGRDMVAIIHHRDHGEIERHRVDIGMLK